MHLLKPRMKLPPSFRKAWRHLSQHLPPLNFITLHYAYFIGVCMLSSIIFWGSSTPSRSITYTDSLFLVVSAMTLAGLNTINLSTINTFQQIILFLLIILGSAILVSILVVHIRRKAFEKRFSSLVEELRQKRRTRSISRRRSSFRTSTSRSRPEVDGVLRGRPIKSEQHSANVIVEGDQVADGHNTQQRALSSDREQSDQRLSHDVGTGDHDPRLSFDPALNRRITFASPNSPTRQRNHTRIFTMQGVGARPNLMNYPKKTDGPVFTTGPPAPVDDIAVEDGEGGQNVLQSWEQLLHDGVVGRNSQFSNLSLAARQKLGGVEYRAVTILSVVVPAYFILWQLLGCIGLGAYVAIKRPDVTQTNGLNPWWVGAFNGVSAFNNSGMSLLDANMTAFQTSDYMLITMGLMILAGNTCYPIFLRLILWTAWKLLPEHDKYMEYKVTLRFLLDHPRRCYTNLFPSRHTWWLLAALVSLNGIDWIAFEILNIGNTTVTSLPSGARALDGLFQALAVRSGGFYVVAIANLRIGLLVLYVIMMYISVYPVVITIRNSNVYEERSLGIYADDPQTQSQKDEPASEMRTNGASPGTANEPAPSSSPAHPSFPARVKRTLSMRPTNNTSPNQQQQSESRGYFVRQQLRSQLSHDIWWITLAVLFITITETSSFERDPVSYSVFNILFEVVSAYGCVGISVGLPNVAYSFCGGWHVLSKLILCAVMLRGRHRGLPVAIDRAVLLPGEHLAAAEEEDARIRLERAGGYGTNNNNNNNDKSYGDGTAGGESRSVGTPGKMAGQQGDEKRD